MEPLEIKAVEEWVNENIVDFHQKKLESLTKLRLDDLLKRKNPYLFKAKNIETASEMVTGLLDAYLSSSEEKYFGDFLEDLARFVAEQTSGGRKSAAPGIDLEFSNKGIYYIVSVKSGPNWGNSSQQNELEQNLKDAVIRVKQRDRSANVQPVLGICYGKVKTADMKRGYLKVVGQNFWYLISENKDLYTDIIEPIGYEARRHNDVFLEEKSNLTNLFTATFVHEYCDLFGAIDWVKLVRHNSENYDLHKFLPE